jgi:hypothetical protein
MSHLQLRSGFLVFCVCLQEVQQAEAQQAQAQQAHAQVRNPASQGTAGADSYRGVITALPSCRSFCPGLVHHINCCG